MGDGSHYASSRRHTQDLWDVVSPTRHHHRPLITDNPLRSPIVHPKTAGRPRYHAHHATQDAMELGTGGPTSAEHGNPSGSIRTRDDRAFPSCPCFACPAEGTNLQHVSAVQPPFLINGLFCCQRVVSAAPSSPRRRVSPTLLDPSRRTVRSGQSDQGRIRCCSVSPGNGQRHHHRRRRRHHTGPGAGGAIPRRITQAATALRRTRPRVTAKKGS